MIRITSLAAVVTLIASPLTAQPGAPASLSLEHRMLLRCSAAFALVAARQETGDAEALAYPPLEERGREFFVRASARVMEEAKLDRAAISDALTREVQSLGDRNALKQVMPPCVAALESSGI